MVPYYDPAPTSVVSGNTAGILGIRHSVDPAFYRPGLGSGTAESGTGPVAVQIEHLIVMDWYSGIQGAP